MKTTFTPENISAFLEAAENADPATLTQLTEGHMSQAFSFETQTGEKLVLRIADTDAGFVADKYAADRFGSALLAPAVVNIGRYEDNSYFCVSKLVLGKTTNILNEAEITAALPNIQAALARIYSYDVSNSTGYGDLDTSSGDASHATWRTRLSDDIETRGEQAFRDNASAIGLQPAIIDKFFSQFRDNLQYASEKRRLLHGDPAFDNMLVDNDEVTAIIDWAQMGYGDWVSDFARLDFWNPKRYGNIQEFATKFGLDDNHLEERVALYWATNALWTIEYADKAKNAGISEWLRKYIEQKLV